MTDPIKPTLPCDHPIEERLHWKIPKNLHIEWCEECGAYRDNKGIEHDGGYNAWQLPNRRTPPPAAVGEVTVAQVAAEAERLMRSHGMTITAMSFREWYNALAAPAPAQDRVSVFEHDTGWDIQWRNGETLMVVECDRAGKLIDVTETTVGECRHWKPDASAPAQTVTDAMANAALRQWYHDGKDCGAFHGDVIREMAKAIEAALAAGEGA